MHKPQNGQPTFGSHVWVIKGTILACGQSSWICQTMVKPSSLSSTSIQSFKHHISFQCSAKNAFPRLFRLVMCKAQLQAMKPQLLSPRSPSQAGPWSCSFVQTSIQHDATHWQCVKNFPSQLYSFSATYLVVYGQLLYTAIFWMQWWPKQWLCHLSPWYVLVVHFFFLWTN